MSLISQLPPSCLNQFSEYLDRNKDLGLRLRKNVANKELERSKLELFLSFWNFLKELQERIEELVRFSENRKDGKTSTLNELFQKEREEEEV
jgi:hypothetical protein